MGTGKTFYHKNKIMQTETIITKFLDWYYKEGAKNPLRFETDNDDIAKMFVLENPMDNNLISDGYHTFGELYEHRITLFIALCRELDRNPAYQSYNITWRMPVKDGWFLMGINLESGKQITYHLPESKWEETNFVLFTDPKDYIFDGHTSNDVLQRLKNL